VTPPKFDVFLSYSEADQQAALVLADALRTSAGLQLFLDRWHLIPGQPWQEEIETALAQSATVAVCVGPSGLSPWHNEQMRIAVDEAVRTRDEMRVIPVLLPGARQDGLSGFLARRAWVDFRAGLDDAEALARLAAGIRGEAIAPGSYTLPDEPAPYRGLLPFEAEQNRFFFGRRDETSQILTRLAQQPFLAIVGASGSGKSSLIRAGVIPALLAGALPASPRWSVLICTPGSQPLRALVEQLALLVASARDFAERLRLVDEFTTRLAEQPTGLSTVLGAHLAAQPESVLLFIDQFEELFTACQEGTEDCRSQMESFVRLLADAVGQGDSRIRILITLRADFLDDAVSLPGLRGLLQDHQFLLGPLDNTNLREAVVLPAQAVGALFEKGLVNTILRDVAAEPAALPLLQHALHELWLARRGPWLTVDAYEASGGVRGALQRRAQATFAALTPSQQRVARTIFLRLTSLGEGVGDTRRRVRRRELYPVGVPAEDVNEVLAALSAPAARLIVADAESVEVAHEALIQQWDTLRGWLEADRAGLRLHRRLTQAAQTWLEMGRDAGVLYRGAQLAQAVEWAAGHEAEMNPLEREFLDASVQLQAQEEVAREAQRRRELESAQQLAQAAELRAQEQASATRRLKQRARLLAGVGLVALILAVIAGVAWLQSNRSAQEARVARATAVAESSRAVDAESTALAERATAVAAGAEAQQQRSLAEQRQKLAEKGQREVEARALANQALRLYDDDPALALLLAREAAQLTYRVNGEVTNEAESALRTLLAKPNTRLIRAIRAHDSHIWSLALHPDGTQFATAGCDQRLPSGLCRAGQGRLWDEQGNLLAEFANRNTDLSLIVFSPDGEQLLTADDTGVVQLWDAGQLHETAVLTGYSGTLRSAVFSPDGQRILTVGETEPARLWSADGELRTVLDEETQRTNSATFSPDGTQLLTAHCHTLHESGFCSAGYARLWDAGGQPVATFAEGAGVNWATFDPSGSRIVTAECAALSDGRCSGGVVRLWDAAGQPLGTLGGYLFRNQVLFATFNPAGTRILANSGNEAALWTTAGEFLTTLGAQVERFWRARFSPDGLLLITTSTRSAPSTANLKATDVYLWDAGGKQVAALPGHEGIVNAAAFTPDHSRLLTAGLDGLVQRWDTRHATGGLERQLAGHKGFLRLAEYSPAGDRLVTVAEDGVRLWDPEGALLAHLEQRATVVVAARFNRQGTQFATVTCDVLTASHDCAKGALRLWNADGALVREVAGYRFPGGFDFAPDGSRMVIAGEGSTARLLGADGQTRAALTGHSGPVNRIAYSKDSIRFATSSDDGAVRIWDGDGEPLLTLTGHTGPSRGVRFSSTNTHLLTYGDDGSLRLWDWDGNPLHVLGGHPGGVKFAAFNRAGTLVLAESNKGPARLWDLDGQLVAVIGENTQSLDVATFDPSGQFILTVECNEVNAGDWCIRHSANLWDIQGTRLYTVDDHWVEWAAFRPDGAQIVTAGCDTFDPLTGTRCEDGGVWLWRAYPGIEAMLAEAEARAGRALTAAECRQYLGAEQCP
jgi:WD40 repeat protein